MANEAAKVSEVNANKRRDADIGAEMEYLEQENEKAAQKIADAEEEVTKELARWMTDERLDDMKLANTPGLFDYPDPTKVPEYLRKYDGTKVRVIPEGYRHRWVRALGNRSRIAWRRAQGYKPRFFDDICKDAEHDWERYGAEGWILNGDCVLMIIEERRAQALDNLIAKRKAMFDSEAEEHLTELGDRYNVEVFRERPDGKREFA